MKMPVRVRVRTRLFCAIVVMLYSLLWSALAASQQGPAEPEVPPQFKLDLETAARLRPQLVAQSVPANGQYTTGRMVFERLVEQVPAVSNLNFPWELRIVEDNQLNAYSSPDGTVYVESGLAKLAGPSTGLWAALLSHEIAHIVRRDWARRYLYEKQLQTNNGAAIVLGDPGQPAAGWEDFSKASEDMGRFCRQIELEADREGLMLMARAGYHPDFVPALHHLLHAQDPAAKTASLYAMHPCWEERDRELSRAYVDASIEFARRWPGWYASPGGNPPVVVFAEQPTVRKTSPKEWQIQIPLRCQNLAGAIEVVLRNRPSVGEIQFLERLPDQPGLDSEVRQLTGCTSPTTTITFTLTDNLGVTKHVAHWNEVYVLDAWGSVLARTEVPKLPR